MGYYCTNCGSENDDGAGYCFKCGITLKHENKIDNRPSSSSSKPYSQRYDYGDVPIYSGKVPQRNYWIYFLISISSVIFIVSIILSEVYFGTNLLTGIAFIVITILLAITGSLVILAYTYHNFNDYKKMIHKYHHSEHLSPHPPLIMVGILLIFEPITLYFKYSQLYDHLTKLHKSYDNLPPSKKAVGFALLGPIIVIPIIGVVAVIFPLIWLLWPLISILLGLLMIYFEQRWQKVFNEHVRYHEEEASG